MREAVREYAARHAELREASDHFVRLVTTILDDAGINYLSVTGRAKSVASFAAKAARTPDGRPVFADPLREITDTIGLRIITYVHSDVAAVADLLGDQVRTTTVTWVARPRARAGSGTPAGTCWSRSTPCGRRPAYEPLRGRQAQVQIARSSSTPGRSSSTTSATRGRSPTSTSPTSTGGSRWRRACSGRTASSPRSATGSRPG